MILKAFALIATVGACLAAEHAYSSQTITRYENNNDHHEEYRLNDQYKNGDNKHKEHEIKYSFDHHPHLEHKLDDKVQLHVQQKAKVLSIQDNHHKNHHHVEHQIKHEVEHKEVHKEKKHEEQHEKKQEISKHIIKHKVEHNEENKLRKHDHHENKQENNHENKHEKHHVEKHEERKHEKPVVKTIVPVQVVPVAQYVHKGVEIHHEPATSYQHIARHDIPAPPPKGFTDYSGPAKYNFAYEVKDAKTGDHKYQNEASDGHTVKGVYGLHESDGSIRTVEYSAAKHTGFSADVKHTVKHIEEKKHYI